MSVLACVRVVLCVCVCVCLCLCSYEMARTKKWNFPIEHNIAVRNGWQYYGELHCSGGYEALLLRIFITKARGHKRFDLINYSFERSVLNDLNIF